MIICVDYLNWCAIAFAIYEGVSINLGFVRSCVRGSALFVCTCRIVIARRQVSLVGSSLHSTRKFMLTMSYRYYMLYFLIMYRITKACSDRQMNTGRYRWELYTGRQQTGPLLVVKHRASFLPSTGAIYDYQMDFRDVNARIKWTRDRLHWNIRVGVDHFHMPHDDPAGPFRKKSCTVSRYYVLFL